MANQSTLAGLERLERLEMTLETFVRWRLSDLGLLEEILSRNPSTFKWDQENNLLIEAASNGLWSVAIMILRYCLRQEEIYADGTPENLFPCDVQSSVELMKLVCELKGGWRLLEAMEYIPNYAILGYNQIWAAVYRNRYKVVEILLNTGDFWEQLNAKDRRGRTPIYLAVDLRETGIYLDIGEHSSRAIYRSTRMVKLLLSYGADPSISTGMNYDPYRDGCDDENQIHVNNLYVLGKAIDYSGNEEIVRLVARNLSNPESVEYTLRSIAMIVNREYKPIIYESFPGYAPYYAGDDVLGRFSSPHSRLLCN